MPFSGLLGALHETGHAMYDLGLPQEWRDQPVGRDRGMALEESQSLLHGNGRRPQPRLRAVPASRCSRSISASAGPEWEPENIYRHLTRVRRSLIRVDADEVTYPLHIMLRYELEKQLLDRRARGEGPARRLERGHGAAPRHTSGQ